MFNVREYTEYYCTVVSATSIEHKFQSHTYLLLPLLQSLFSITHFIMVLHFMSLVDITVKTCIDIYFFLFISEIMVQHLTEKRDSTYHAPIKTS